MRLRLRRHGTPAAAGAEVTAEDWQMGNAGAEAAAAAAAGGAAEDGPKATAEAAAGTADRRSEATKTKQLGSHVRHPA